MKIFADNTIIKDFINQNNYSDASKTLFEIQKNDWQMLKNGLTRFQQLKQNLFNLMDLK